VTLIGCTLVGTATLFALNSALHLPLLTGLLCLLSLLALVLISLVAHSCESVIVDFRVSSDMSVRGNPDYRFRQPLPRSFDMWRDWDDGYRPSHRGTR